LAKEEVAAVGIPADGLWRARHLHRSGNPERIAAFSPGMAQFREGLPWVAASKFPNPERVEYQRLTKLVKPFQGGMSLYLHPG